MLGITHAQASNQRGFTLIEMSIVLVIIGLIIGGILKGQEIIESSRQKNVITQIDSMRASVNTFADKYNALPGDYGLASTRINADLSNGDDSGIIGTDSSDLDASADGLAQENQDFFNHLNAADLIGGTTLNGATTGFGEQNALPAIAVPGAGFTMAYGEYSSTGQPGANKRTHWLRTHRGPGDDIGSNQAVFIGKRMFEIDLKIDDTNGLTGTSRVAPANQADTDCVNATGQYDALSNVQACDAFFELIQ